MLVNIAKELPDLQELSVGISYDVSLCGVKEVLQHSKMLASFSICLEKIAMDLEDFYNIFALAQNHTRVEIKYKEGTIDVEKNILDAHQMWLKIEKC